MCLSYGRQVVCVSEAVAGIAFELNFDGSKLMTNINSFGQKIKDSITKSFSDAGKSAKKTVEASNSEIQAILDDTSRTARSKAAAIASIYKKEGDSASDAMKKAWSHIERESSNGSKSIKKDMKSMSKQAQKTAKNMKDNFSSSFSAIAKKAAVVFAAAFSAKKLIDFGKECLELGSDLAEVQNVVDVTFPAMSKKVDEFAQGAANAFGLSETMAKQFTGTFGAMAKAFGFSEKAAYDMSTTLTGLAGDVASFYNLSQDAAYTKLKSVFTGETESLKDLGIVMTQTALDSYALANGFGKTTAKMTEAEKVALRYKFVQEQLAGATGDFARTSGGWANQVRILSLQFDSLKASIGQGLINLFTPVIKIVNTLIGKLMLLASAFRSFTEMVTGQKSSGGISADMENTAQAAGNAAAAVEGVGDAAAASAKKAKRALAGFDSLQTLDKQEDGGGAGGSAGGASMDFGTLDTGALKEAEARTDAILGKWQGLARLFKQGFKIGFGDSEKRIESIRQHIQGIGQSLKDIFTDGAVEKAAAGLFESVALNAGKVSGSFTRIGLTVADNLIGGFDGYLQGSAGYIKERIVSVFDVSGELAGLAGELSAALADIFDVFSGDSAKGCTEHLTGIFADTFLGITDLTLRFGQDVAACIANPIIENKDKIGEALENTLAPLDGILAALHGLVQDTFQKIFQVYEEYLEPAFANISSGFSTVFSGILDAYNNYLAPVLDWIAERFTALVSEYIQPLINAFLDFCGKAVEALSMLWDFLSPFVSWFAEGFIARLAERLQWLWTFIEAVVAAFAAIIQGVIEICSGLIDFIVGVFTGNWEKAWTGIKEIFGGICTAIQGVFKAVGNLISNVFTTINTTAGNALDLLKSLVTRALNAISTVFRNVFTGIKNTVVSIFNGIWNVIRNVINSILGGVESMSNGLIRGINGMISALNKISFSIPDWVPGLGGKSFGISLPSMPEVSIPRLAQGGYVKPNTPQLAMIGDNRHQGEIVAPEDKIYQVSSKAMWDVMQQFMAAMKAMAGSAMNGETTIVLNVTGDMAPFIRMLRWELDREMSRRGINLEVRYE